MDIFSAGCIYYYVITGGSHPFEDKNDSDGMRISHNIARYKPFFDLSKVGQNFLGDIRIIQKMVSKDPKCRPPAEALLCHHIFWSKQKGLDFISCVSDILSRNKCNMKRFCIERANDNYSKALYTKHNWKQLLSPMVQHEIANKKYGNKFVLGITKAVQTFLFSYDHLPQKLQTELGKPPNDFFNYWSSRWPFLLDHLYANFEKLRDQDAYLQKFYCSNYEFDYYYITAEDASVFAMFTEKKIVQILWEKQQQQTKTILNDSSYESDVKDIRH